MDDADQLFKHPQNAYTKKLIAALPGIKKGVTLR
jgi:ABC-type oligopeptide transport system ATPase subunit